MTHLFEDKTKNSWTIFFYDETNKRKSISLQRKKYTKKTADIVVEIVDALVYYRNNGIETPSLKILSLIKNIDPMIRQKLAKAGLYSLPEEKPKHTCQELWKEFMQVKAKERIKEGTLETYENSKRRFFLFFSKDDKVADLTTDRMKEFKTFLRTQPTPKKKKGLAESTTAGTLTKTKAAFNWAVKQGWIDSSPLYGFGVGSFVNKDNERFITMAEYDRLLDACPCQEWKTIIALVRIGGLRCPSEVLRLRWADVDWEKSQFYVRSPKTEHHKGKEGRLVPLFPDLRKELDELFLQDFDDNDKPTEYVINRYRDRTRTNLRTQFQRIAKMAGMKEDIPRAFSNMRASRSSEVYADFGAFLESQWIGHSTKTAMKHYLQVRPEDIARAVQWTCRSAVGSGESFPKRPVPHRNREPEAIVY